MKTKYCNFTLVTADGCETGKNICTEDGIISAVTEENLPADRVIDCGGNYLSAGWIDIHTHGAGGADFLDGTPEAYHTAARMHGIHGAAAILPTTTSVDRDRIVQAAAAFEEAKKFTDIPDMPGLHLEGPYLASSQKGAQEDRFIHPFDTAETAEILAASDKILRWTAAPELKGAGEFAKTLTERGILPCIGHTDATFSETEEAYRQGFTHITHLYSCMSTVHRVNAYRVAGVLEAAYYLDGMTVEIIADGSHLPAELLKYVVKFKGRENIALVTDSMRAAGMGPGESVLGALDNGLPVIVEDGVAKLTDRSAFAGSVATCDLLIRTMVGLAEVPLHDAVYMLTETPARIMGWTDRGRIAPGYRADFTVFDREINVTKTIVADRVIHG